MRIYIKESDRTIDGPRAGRPLWESLVDDFRARELAGVTVLRGIAGYGITHTARSIFSELLAHDLPIVIEVVDTRENIDRVRPDLEGLIGTGVVTFERVDTIIFRRDDA